MGQETNSDEPEAMNPLDSLIRKHVGPIATSAGFRKSGHTFWMAGDRLDYVCFRFNVHRVDPEATVFDVEFHAIPDPYGDWLNRGQQPAGKVPNFSGALVTGRVIAPRSVAHRPDSSGAFRARWAFRPGGEEACGRVLAETLRAEALPRIQLMAHRARLLEDVRSSDVPLMKRMTPVLREIVLRIDDIEVAELASLLLEAEASGAPAVGFVDWAYERQAARARARADMSARKSQGELTAGSPGPWPDWSVGVRRPGRAWLPASAGRPGRLR